MKTTDWKGVAELIGLAAIVASLIFVGLEMRQSHSIALAEQQGALIGTTQQTAEILIEHAQLVLKINAGAPLTPKEEFVADKVLWAVWANAFFSYRRWEYLNHPAVRALVREFARIFNQNPGLKRLWLASWETRHSELIALGANPNTEIDVFAAMVEQYLNVLEGDST